MQPRRHENTKANIYFVLRVFVVFVVAFREVAERRRQVADDRRLVARHVARVGVVEHDRVAGAERAARRASPRPSARRRTRDPAGRRARCCSPSASKRETQSMTTPSSRAAAARVVIVRQIRAGDEERAPAARGPPRARRRALAPCRRSDSPSPAARSPRPGARRCRNGSCISSECSRACAAGCSRTIGVAARRSAAQASSIGATPNGVSKPPDGTTATPSKPTKCDGPTSTATSNVRPRSSRYACAATGPEYISPACGAMSATSSPSRSTSSRSASGEMPIDGRRERRRRIPGTSCRRPLLGRDHRGSTVMPIASLAL